MAADELMHEWGYNAVGVAELCQRAGVRKGSFYHFFGSKQDLALEMLDRAWQRTRLAYWHDTIDDPNLATTEGVARFGHALAAQLRATRAATGGVNGCRFGNFAVELGAVDDRIRGRISAVFDEMVDLLAGAIQRDIERGAVAGDVEPVLTARLIVAQMEGLMVLAKASGQPDELTRLAEVGAALLPPPR